MTVYSYPQLVQFANNAGFSGSSANTIAAISLAESSGDSTKINPNDPGSSYGLLQINGAAWGESEAQASLDPQTAFDNAYSISASGTNFAPWSTYTSDAYSKYLPSGGNTVTAGANPNISYSIAGTDANGGTANDPTSGAPGYGGSVNSSASGASDGGLPSVGNPGSTGSVSGAASGSGLGTIANILNDVWNIVERGGLILIGIVLVGIAAYVISKPHVEHTVKAIGKAIP